VLCAFDPRRGTQEELCDLVGGAGPDMYVARGARDASGAFCFGKIMAKPAGYYRVRLPGPAPAGPVPLRMWG
jgi:hypothetical protein